MTDDPVISNACAQQTSSGLLQGVKANEQEAWERFVYLYSPLIYSWCRRAGLQEADAADVGQEIFRAVSCAIANFRHGQKGNTLRGWLGAITKNKLRDLARSRQEEKCGVGGSDALDRLMKIPAEDVAASDEATIKEETLLLHRRVIDLILTEFEEVSRRAFLRVVVEDQSPADVARELGISTNAVYLAKSRILRRVREEFEGLVWH